MRTAFIDYTGKRFGRLVVIKYVGLSKNRSRLWECICDCGKVRTTQIASLLNGNTRSCGCYQKLVMKRLNATARFTHGMSRTITYTSWRSMLIRCRNKKDEHWPRYGGRGIKVCERWVKFEAFLEDMGERPSPAHTIERKRNDGDYELDNCKWATSHEQSRNKGNTRKYWFDGKRLCLPDWSLITGINLTTLRKRIQMGWSNEQTLTKDVR